MPVSKRRIPKSVVQSIMNRDHASRELALDKMHVSKMARACMGIMVAFAFDDEQALRAACWFLAHCALQLGRGADPIVAQFRKAYELVQADNGQSPALSGSGIVAPDGSIPQ